MLHHHSLWYYTPDRSSRETAAAEWCEGVIEVMSPEDSPTGCDLGPCTNTGVYSFYNRADRRWGTTASAAELKKTPNTHILDGYRVQRTANRGALCCLLNNTTPTTSTSARRPPAKTALAAAAPMPRYAARSPPNSASPSFALSSRHSPVDACPSSPLLLPFRKGCPPPARQQQSQRSPSLAAPAQLRPSDQASPSRQAPLRCVSRVRRARPPPSGRRFLLVNKR